MSIIDHYLQSESSNNPSQSVIQAKGATYSKYSAYKDSCIQWLGIIPEHWDLTRLGSYFHERRTKVSDKDYAPLSVTKQGILPQLETAAKSNDGDNRKLVKKGDFVINSRSDRKGSSGIANEDGSVSLINIVMKPTSIHPIYCNYLLKSNGFVEENYRIGHGIVADLWTTRFDEMKNIKIGLPTFEEQITIATFLDDKTAKIDQAIAQKEKLIALLKERKQIIIQNAVTKGLDPNVKLKDSGVEWIGEIPEHWETPKLKHICIFILDGTHGSYPRVFDGYRLLSVRNIVNGKFTLRNDDSRVSFRHFHEISSKFLIEKGDIQLAIVGATLGKVAIVEELHEKIVTQRSLSTIRINKQKCLVEYIYFYLQSELFQSFLWNNTGFSAQPGIYLGTIQNSNLPFPSKEEQLSIVNHIQIQFAKIDQTLSLQLTQIEKLKEYKATLIDSAVTGKIKVS